MSSRKHKPIHVEQHNFLRPPIDFSVLHDNDAPITFQILQMDDTNCETTQWEVEKRLNPNARPHYWGYYVRLYGIDERGHSVTAYVSGFKPFIHIQVPATWTNVDMMNAISSGATRVAMENGIRFSERDVASVEQTWRVQFYGFTNFEKIPMFKINFNHTKARDKFIQLCDCDRTWANYDDLNFSFWLWDTCMTPLVQFENVHNILPTYWVTVKGGSYRYRDSPPSRQNIFLQPHERRTRAQLDIDCSVESLTCDMEKSDICKFLILCEDIEVAGQQGYFPEPMKADYPVIQIGATVQRFGDPPNKYVSQCCFCLRETENLRPDDVKIYWFEEEAQLLEAYYYYWTDCVDADMRVAFNQYGFDGPYLYNRYLKLLTHMIPKAVLDGTASYFDQGALDYGKVRNLRSKLETKDTGSRAHGGSKKHIIDAPGRIEIDVMVYAREEWKMIVGLNILAAAILGDDEQKDDIHFSQITPMFNGDAQTRGKLAKYCVRDTELPLMILEKKCVIIEQIEKSRLTGVTLHMMFNRKQTVRVETLLFRETHRSEERYSIPQEPFRFIKDLHLLALFKGEHGREGALILPAEPNFFTQPVCTLDFAGLYPSIIRGMMLCYTTLILDLKYLSVVEYRKDVVRNKQLGGKPYDIYWAKLPNDRKPLLYRVLTNILDARAAAKKTMKQFPKDSLKYSIYNARQLALKVVANATYGYTVIDHDKCKLPCAAIGITVTHYGRQMIQTTREEVQKRIPGSRVLYGDSVKGDTPLCLLVCEQFYLLRFDEIAQKFGLQWQPYEQKESLDVHEYEFYVWSDVGFTKVNRFIRHRLEIGKKLYRVVTNAGIVDATDNHSLLNTQKQSISVENIRVEQTELLHQSRDSFLTDIILYSGNQCFENESFAFGWLAANTHIDYNKILSLDKIQSEFFLSGFCAAQAKRLTDTLTFSNKNLCALIWILFRRIVYFVTIDATHELISLTASKNEKVSKTVKKVIELSNITHNEFVYDVETESHHFHVAPGNLIVHNTDSVMVMFSQDASIEAFRKAFPIGKQVAKEISGLFPEEVSLEFEKIYYPYYLLQQKNYAGIVFTDPNEDPNTGGQVKISGLASVKSDTIKIVARWVDTIIEKFLRERDYHNAKTYLIEELKQFVRNPVAAEDVAISVKMSKEISEYTGNNEVAAVAAAIAKRDPGRAPGAGHKITFVHCLDKQRHNTETPVDIEWYEQNRDRYTIDKKRYLHNLMIETVGKLFDLPNIAHDPYQWFLPFERALKTQQNGGGIAKFLVSKPAAAQTVPATEKVPDVRVDAAKEEATKEETTKYGNELSLQEIVNDSGVKIAAAAAQKEDAEFPMYMFKDTPYAKQSEFKKNRLKKAAEKKLADECRRLSVTIKSAKVDAEKRKLGLPISHFFKVRKIGDEEQPQKEKLYEQEFVEDDDATIDDNHYED